MTKLYKAVDKMDGRVSSFLIHNGMVAVSGWREEGDQLQIARDLIDIYEYQDIEAFERRAINPILIAEW